MRFDKYDEKIKSIPKTAGYSIFESSETLPQDKLLEAQALGVVSFDNRLDDFNCENLMDTVISIIVEDLRLEIVQREVSLSCDTHVCTTKYAKFSA